ncbi:hypothetical protein SGQ83_12240 [Flavobacterium sp. Fl-318]|uniref:Exo-alpha-sialidase n=1 Tax=Flavobacterium cupriresistens TaxID=2893885 RepID=A0ABU4RCW9_9FLAO|nr:MULTISPECIES: hypothetical protein [unclassified Flavobacterium]MDX6190121.1 hypothetical protein [Flavobacterium sp. Fl-318]UFH42942.1 hypothetical protein LNP23_01690 [Flavobacterium sp. F-323]
MKIKLFSFLVVLVFCISCSAQDEDDNDKVITQRITTNEGMNNAFTDLVFFNNKWFISYRESDKHGLGKDGVVKVLSSFNGVNWDLVKEYVMPGIDLRNASFTVNDNQLTAYIHGSKYVNRELVAFTDYKTDYNKESGEWLDLKDVVLDKKKGYETKLLGNEAWPWKVTWYKGKAYSFAYGLNGLFDLYKSSDGLKFNNTNSVQKMNGTPTEATLEVDEEGTFYVLVRKDFSNGIMGKSTDRGNSWEWFGEIPIYDFGGPDFVFYKGGILLSGRESHQVILGYYNFKTNSYQKVMTLKSGGDCSYPGMVIKDGYLWMSYYSAHRNTTGTSIYFSKISLENLGL